jgi:hypothetical protein
MNMQVLLCGLLVASTCSLVPSEAMPPPPPPQQQQQQHALPGRQQVVAFDMEMAGAPVSFWLDYDWDILTHVITYGYTDPLMVRYAKSRGIKLLQDFNGCNDQLVNDSAVRRSAPRLSTAQCRCSPRPRTVCKTTPTPPSTGYSSHGW